MKQARKRGVWCLPRVRARSECAEVSRQRGLGGKRRERRVRKLGLVAPMCYARAATRLRWRRQSRRVYTARADARLGQTRAAGTNERMWFSPENPQGPKIVRPRAGLLRCKAWLLSILSEQLFQWSFRPWSSLLVLAADWWRAKAAQDGVQSCRILAWLLCGVWTESFVAPDACRS